MKKKLQHNIRRILVKSLLIQTQPFGTFSSLYGAGEASSCYIMKIRVCYKIWMSAYDNLKFGHNAPILKSLKIPLHKQTSIHSHISGCWKYVYLFLYNKNCLESLVSLSDRVTKTEYHWLGGLNSRNLWSPVLKAGVWDPGVGRAGSSWGLSPGRVDGCLLPVSSQGRTCVCVCVCVLISSYKDTSPMGSRPALVTSLYLHRLFKDPVSKSSHIFWGPGGWDFNIWTCVRLRSTLHPIIMGNSDHEAFDILQI